MLSDRKIWTWPNLLSLIRLLLIAPVMFALVHEKRVTAGLFIGLGILTDLSDGWLARKLNQCSDLGRMMDPVIDKVTILAVSSMLVFSNAYSLPLWFFVFMCFRECFIIVISGIMIKKHRRVLESLRPGKVSAFLVGIAVFIHIFGWQPYSSILLYTAFAATLYSSWIYFRRFFLFMKSPDAVSKTGISK